MSINTDYPTLTVGIPAYNESADIERVVREFLATAYPNLIEVFVADGGSTDNTEDIVKKLSLEDPRVKLIHNPLKIQSAGLNAIIKESKGDIFLRADAHSDYASDYVERCVEALIESKAINAGGAQRFVAKQTFQAAITLASKSILGNGGAHYRDPNYIGFVDTIYLGCFWRKSLLEISEKCKPYGEIPANEDFELNTRLNKFIFDNTQITNQDAELNQRLIDIDPKAIYSNPKWFVEAHPEGVRFHKPQKSTNDLGRLYQSNKIKVWYYPRKTWKSLILQYFKYGRGRCLTSSKHPLMLQIRGIIPFTVIALAIFMLIIDLLFPSLSLPIKTLFLLGICLAFLDSLRLNLQYSKTFRTEIWRGDVDAIPSFLSLWFLCGVVLLTMPIAHFSGYAYQLIRNRIYRIDGW
jgi:succinoglycan biosynthesis protein ExoA